MIRPVVLIVLLALGGCAMVPDAPINPFGQARGWENCKGPVQTVASARSHPSTETGPEARPRPEAAPPAAGDSE